MPIFKAYPETMFGGDFLTEADYRDPFLAELIDAEGWMLWPPIRYHHQTVAWDLPTPAPSAPDREHWLGTDDQARDEGGAAEQEVPRSSTELQTARFEAARERHLRLYLSRFLRPHALSGDRGRHRPVWQGHPRGYQAFHRVAGKPRQVGWGGRLRRHRLTLRAPAREDP